MKNPFKPDNSPAGRPGRNNFDESFTNHVTGNFGQLLPVGVWPVLPSDHFRITTAMGLRFMPLVFPVQCRMKAYIHFFYQRNKNLWSGFNDFIYYNKPADGNPDHDAPYIVQDPSSTESRYTTGSIYDYLGLPTADYNLKTYPYVIPYTSNVNVPLLFHSERDLYTSLDELSTYGTGIIQDMLTNATLVTNGSSSITTRPGALQFMRFQFDPDWGELQNYKGDFEVTIVFSRDYFESVKVIPAYITNPSQPISTSNEIFLHNEVSVVDASVIDYTDDSGALRQRVSFTLPSRDYSSKEPDVSYDYDSFFLAVVPKTQQILNVGSIVSEGATLQGPTFVEYDGDFYKGRKFNALRFRCYESIYNAFYRDARNNPLLDDRGDPIYNKYLKSDGSGRDSFPYKIHTRNWQFDQFTSCVPSPQQGTAPLVGISSLGDVSFQSQEDGKTYTFSTETASDADTITKINVTSNVPNDVARSIMNSVTQGISINDFRNVNAMQKWLETNIRRGMKIKDQTKARWGIDLKENNLDMPEFIGGFSVPIDINQVSQTSETDVAPLGAYAGQATGFGGSKHDVSCYCDQHGYIMAILSVVPDPLYDSLIDKDLFRLNALDYFNPEFGHIGYQPVYNKELAPFRGNPEGVFGYQRPWYDYLIKNDEIHGLFRTSLRNFVLARNFDKLPTLNSDFTTIHHDQLNNIFSVDNSDKFLGMIRFNVTAARPIPSTSIPSLG